MNKKPSPLHRASEWIVDHYRLFFVVFAALLVFSAVASGWVKVENDVAAYLPADSETRQGLDIMEQEFQTYGSAKILLRDTDADAAAATAEQIHAVDGVDSCTYTMNDTGSALLSVSLSDLEGSDTCAQTVQALRDLLDGSTLRLRYDEDMAGGYYWDAEDVPACPAPAPEEEEPEAPAPTEDQPASEDPAEDPAETPEAQPTEPETP